MNIYIVKFYYHVTLSSKCLNPAQEKTTNFKKFLAQNKRSIYISYTFYCYNDP